jgi:anaphase-promoting complex subunit 3
MIESSLALDPLNPLAKFKKANILVSLNQLDLAIEELKSLIDIEPNEPSVYSLLGKIYNKSDKQQEAMKYFNIALDLENPQKDHQSVKTEMSKMFEEDDEDDEELDQDDSTFE